MANQSTLKEYLFRSAQDLPNGNNLASLLLAITECTKSIAHLISQGALSQITAKLSTTNVQGETQMQLDVLTNDLFIATLECSGLVAGAVSEELDEPYLFKGKEAAPFLVAFDPLDGSSNIAVNVSVGSIFCILPSNTLSTQHEINSTNYLQSGVAQMAAGYVLYGPATMLVLTTGKGSHGFTLDVSSQEFLLTHSNIQIPEVTSEFAINASNQRFWEPPVKRYVSECCDGITGLRERDFNMRWVASMVADVHRILMRGGVYLYPKDKKLPAKAGRLRLLYEANPMSFIVEQAGGKSSTGRERILQLTPSQIHERVPVILGSYSEVCLIELYHDEFDVHLLEEYSLSI
ncbi:MAG: class 1 fructose-bisphosphatase [Methylophilaceae bacterium]|nr:class 1 fructose-bisphosphatase [Methylophilaceae bacterium]